jgi:hypothetical protein
MDLKLVRNKFALYGITGELLKDNGTRLCFTLEHSYAQPMGGCLPKLANGIYTCQRGQHRLDGMALTFETFEILGVPRFMGAPVTGILFHKGNSNNDSHGCVLVGLEMGQGCILESALAFGEFLQIQEGCDQFTLTVC